MYRRRPRRTHTIGGTPCIQPLVGEENSRTNAMCPSPRKKNTCQATAQQKDSRAAAAALKCEPIRLTIPEAPPK